MEGLTIERSNHNRSEGNRPRLQGTFAAAATAAILALSFVAAGCPAQPAVTSCETNADCYSDEVCQSGTCVQASSVEEDARESMDDADPDETMDGSNLADSRTEDGSDGNVGDGGPADDGGPGDGMTMGDGATGDGTDGGGTTRPKPQWYRISSGGGEASSSSYKMRVDFGGASPTNTATSSSYRARLKPVAP